MSVGSEWFTIEQFVAEGRGGSVLTSPCAVRWALRQHSRALISAGVVIPGAGRRPTLVSAALADAYIEILKREAAAMVLAAEEAC